MNRIPRSAPGVLILLWLGTASAEAQEVQVEEAVHQYPSGETRVTVEWFAPLAEGKFPAVLLLHGSGGLEQSTGDLFREIARGLSSEGYVVLIPHYFERTAHVVGKPFGDKEIPAFLEAVHDAIEFAVASRVVDSERIGVVGWSLGSHLAFFRSTKDPRIKAIVSISGHLPVEWKSKFPPVLIIQGSKDKGTPAQRLKDFQEKLKTQNTPCVSHVYKGVGHNLDLPTWDDVSRRMAVFFNKYLKRPAPSRTKGRPKKSTAKT
jgi:carboxymethylenebutenolidase